MSARPMVALLLVIAGCTDDERSLQELLDHAGPGGVVAAGPGRHTGPLVIPAGVSLAGAGRDATTLVAGPGEIAVRMGGGATSGLRDLAIESDGRAAVIVSGGAGAALQNVTIRATRGIGIGAEDLDVLTLTDVRLVGPITPENAEDIPGSAGPDETATHGLVVVRVRDARVSNVEVTGFAGFGALLFESGTTWTGGSASDNLGTGVMVEGGTAMFESLEASRTLEGARLVPAYGIVFSGGAAVTSRGLRLTGGDRYGLLHVGSTARHEDLVAEDNGDAAVWIQGSTSVELSGAGTSIARNHFGGVVAVDSSGVSITGGRIEGTLATRQMFELVGEVEVGDAIQLVRSAEGAVVRDVTLTDNARIGLLIELGSGRLDGATFERITVGGTGTQLGAVAQGGTIPPGWDTGVTRTGATAANDAAIGAALEVVGVIGTSSRPAIGPVGDEGLGGIIGPDF